MNARQIRVTGPMHAAIERLRQVALARHLHYSRRAELPIIIGRQQTALRMAAYYRVIADRLAEAARESEYVL